MTEAGMIQGEALDHVCAVWAFGADRPGIVAAVTGALFEAGCNLEDCSMTLLSGQFAVVMLVRSPLEPDALEERVRTATQSLGLLVAVRLAAPIARNPEAETDDGADGTLWMVSVYGADRPGIVHRITTELAGAGVNIADCKTRTVGAADAPVYVMLLEAVVPASVDAESLRRRLDEAAHELGVEATVRTVEPEIL